MSNTKSYLYKFELGLVFLPLLGGTTFYFIVFLLDLFVYNPSSLFEGLVYFIDSANIFMMLTMFLMIATTLAQMIIIYFSEPRIENMRMKIFIYTFLNFILSFIISLSRGSFLFEYFNAHKIMFQHPIEFFAGTIFSILSIPIIILFIRNWKNEYKQLNIQNQTL